MTITADTALLLETVERFAAKAEQRLFAAESPDGDLAVVDELLDDAVALGLLAAPPSVDANTGGWGVWGAQAEVDGAAMSLDMLRRLGRTCAGLATAVHAQGLAVLLLGGHTAPGGAGESARLAAAFCPPVGAVLDPRTFGDGLTLDGGLLDGIARFALLPGRADALVLAARADGDGWAVVAVAADAPGLRLAPTGARIGLRACAMADLHVDRLPVRDNDIRLTGAPARRRVELMVGCDWLGQAAVALGTAERAVADAADYAAGRVQGGVVIREHAAIRLLLGRAEHDVAVLADVLARHADTPLADLDPARLLRWAADARLVAGEHAARAVTDALQVLGGYGYMDEYGLSKRLRDLTALRVLHGGPDQLVLLRGWADA